MELKHQNEIKLIENCPIGNQKGAITLYRCVEYPITNKSFEPHAVLNKPKYKNNCLAWGISMFCDLKSAKEVLKSLSLKKKESINIQCIASGLITDNDGVKHQTKNLNHYTFYPKVDIDLISKFAIVTEKE